MKSLRRKITKQALIVATFVITAAAAHGQNNGSEDVIYLKNGDVVRGELIGSSTSETLRIQIDNSNILLYDISEVSKISKENKVNMPTNFSQNQNMVLIERKNPGTAFVFSLLIPGGGQFYNGESKKGLIQLGMAFTGIMIAYTNWPDYEWVKDEYYWASYGYTREYGNETLMYAGLALYLGGAVWSLIDAPLSAGRINRENGLAGIFEEGKKVEFNLTDLNIDGQLTPGVRCTWAF